MGKVKISRPERGKLQWLKQENTEALKKHFSSRTQEEKVSLGDFFFIKAEGSCIAGMGGEKVKGNKHDITVLSSPCSMWSLIWSDV